MQQVNRDRGIAGAGVASRYFGWESLEPRRLLTATGISSIARPISPEAAAVQFPVVIFAEMQRSSGLGFIEIGAVQTTGGASSDSAWFAGERWSMQTSSLSLESTPLVSVALCNEAWSVSTDTSTLASTSTTSTTSTVSGEASTSLARPDGSGGRELTTQPQTVFPVYPGEPDQRVSSPPDVTSPPLETANPGVSRARPGDASKTTGALTTVPGALPTDTSSSNTLAVDAITTSGPTQANAQSQSTITGFAESMEPVVRGLTGPALTATFSVLPLALKELQAVLSGASGAAQAAATAAGQPGDLHGGPASAVKSDIVAVAASTRTAMVNLFHVDALATFRDAIGTFIEESAAGSVRHPLGHRRAWTITAAVLAADAALGAYWIASRRAKTSDQRKLADQLPALLPLAAAALQR
jgi:hypothetical protein